jgi:hypothetical protein
MHAREGLSQRKRETTERKKKREEKKRDFNYPPPLPSIDKTSIMEWSSPSWWQP